MFSWEILVFLPQFWRLLTGYEILDLYFFPGDTKICHSTLFLLARLQMRSLQEFLSSSLPMWYVFFLLASFKLFSFYWFTSLWIDVPKARGYFVWLVGCFVLGVYPVHGLSISWISALVSGINFGKLRIITSNIFFCSILSFFCCCSSDSDITPFRIVLQFLDALFCFSCHCFVIWI